jgi:drug/metabolite transporter (DMT)-like permease
VRAYASLGFGVICIGFSAIFTKWANLAGTVHISGAVSAFYRVLIATIALAIPYAIHVERTRRKNRVAKVEEAEASDEATALEPTDSKQSLLKSKILWGTFIAGLFFALDLGFWNTSLLFTSAANATLLGNLSTLWVSLGALFIFHESLKKRFWWGMALALVGVTLVVGRDVIEHPVFGWGDLLAIFSSSFYATYILATNRVRRKMGTLSFMWLNSAVATVLLFAYVTVAGEQLWGFSAGQWWSLIALGLISHALGWMAINYSLGHLPAPLTSVTLLSQPVITALVAVPMLGENLAVNQIAGGVIVLVGIYIVNRK